MRQIRFGVFETNSSSVHTLVMCSDEEYKKLKDGEMFLERWGGKVLSRDEAIKKERDILKYLPEFMNTTDDEIIEMIKNNDVDGEVTTFDDFGSDFEYFDETYETKDGEVIHAFGYYGHD